MKRIVVAALLILIGVGYMLYRIGEDLVEEQDSGCRGRRKW
ncbi:MAG: hypothetical protein Q4C73_03105 [Eubacteriales bacterium]|nr:hypothetical protein [Eubacteriales bacterium]